MRIRDAAAVVFAAALFSVATVWVTAQAVIVNPVTPTVIAGSDVGFRVQGLRGGTPVGRVVLRIKGQWVDAELAGALEPLSRR